MTATGSRAPGRTPRTRHPALAAAVLSLGAVGLSGCAAGAGAPAPAATGIPSAARVVTLTLRPGLGARGSASTATDASPGQVSRIAGLTDGLAAVPSNAVYSCPAATGGSLTLTFRARADGPGLATVVASLSGCQFVRVTVGGKAQPAAGPEAGARVAAQAIKIAGLHWRLPR